MTFTQTFGVINDDRTAGFLGQGLERTVRAAAGAGFRTLLTGGRIVDDKRSIHEAHEGIGVVFAGNAVELMRGKSHGHPDLIGDPMTGHPVAELFANQTADVFAPFRQRTVPGGFGNLI